MLHRWVTDWWYSTLTFPLLLTACLLALQHFPIFSSPFNLLSLCIPSSPPLTYLTIPPSHTLAYVKGRNGGRGDCESGRAWVASLCHVENILPLGTWLRHGQWSPFPWGFARQGESSSRVIFPPVLIHLNSLSPCQSACLYVQHLFIIIITCVLLRRCWPHGELKGWLMFCPPKHLEMVPQSVHGLYICAWSVTPSLVDTVYV